jgi:hypothetical protein
VKAISSSSVCCLLALFFHLCCGSVAISAADDPETFDLATFRHPAGWERIAPQGQGPFLLRAPDRASQIVIFPSRATANGSTAVDQFRADWAKLVVGPFGEMDLPKYNTEQTPSGWTAVSGASTNKQLGARSAAVLYTATGFGRSMSIAVLVTGQQALADVAQFFKQLQLRVPPASTEVAVPTAPVAPQEGARSLEGLYYSMQAGITSGARLEVRTRYFLKGNRIARVFPFGGGDQLDVSRCSPDTCGTYTIDPAGQWLNVRWDNGQMDRQSLSQSVEGLNIGGTLYRQAVAVAPESLAGVWTGAGETGNSFLNVYRFESNGSFTFGSGQRGFGGRYRVVGLTLILNFSDGDVRRRTLFSATNGNSPARMIVVDGEVFVRK